MDIERRLHDRRRSDEINVKYPTFAARLVDLEQRVDQCLNRIDEVRFEVATLARKDSDWAAIDEVKAVIKVKNAWLTVLRLAGSCILWLTWFGLAVIVIGYVVWVSVIAGVFGG